MKEQTKEKVIWVSLAIYVGLMFILPFIIGPKEKSSVSFMSAPVSYVCMILKENLSYYGTVFSVLPGFIGVIWQNRQLQKEGEQNKQRHREKQEIINKQLIEQKEREIEQKEREIEQKNDYYRPSFVQENNTLRLVMKNQDLFLLDVYILNDYSPSICPDPSYIGDIKSGYIFTEKLPNEIYIMGRTMRGEYILFGIVKGGFYTTKYLSIRYQKDVNYLITYFTEYSNWKSYNNSYSDYIDKWIFDRVEPLMELIASRQTNVFAQLYIAKTPQELLQNAFSHIIYAHDVPTVFTDESLVRVVNAIYDIVVTYSESFIINSDQDIVNCVKHNELYITKYFADANLTYKPISISKDDSKIIIPILKHFIDTEKACSQINIKTAVIKEILAILQDCFRKMEINNLPYTYDVRYFIGIFINNLEIK